MEQPRRGLRKKPNAQDLPLISVEPHEFSYTPIRIGEHLRRRRNA
jgi:hypothetical protein